MQQEATFLWFLWVTAVASQLNQSLGFGFSEKVSIMRGSRKVLWRSRYFPTSMKDLFFERVLFNPTKKMFFSKHKLDGTWNISKSPAYINYIIRPSIVHRDRVLSASSRYNEDTNRLNIGLSWFYNLVQHHHGLTTRGSTSPRGSPVCSGRDEVLGGGRHVKGVFWRGEAWGRP